MSPCGGDRTDPNVHDAQRLRRAADAEIRRVRASYADLTTDTASREPSFLRVELLHDKGEAIMARRDETSRTFYFFRAGRLWKIYKVFEPLVLPEGNFAAFRASLERSFGPGEMLEEQIAGARVRSRFRH